MGKTRLLDSVPGQFNVRQFLLVFIWCFSIVTGVYFAHAMQDCVYSLMCIVPMYRVSIVGLIVVLLFPLVFSAVAALYSIADIIYLALFLDGVSLGYFLSGVLIAFRFSGWLIGLLVSFSKCFFTIPRLWFYSCCLNTRTGIAPIFMRCVCVALVIGIIDYCFVSPFLSALMF